jgi:signal transduction histidine kinase/DNA-binding NarL/FixJ family response regulator
MKELLRVLILDASQHDAQSYAQQLLRAGFDLDWVRVATPQDFERDLNPSPDLILAGDLTPPFNALDAYMRLKELGVDIPFIIISDPTAQETAVRCLKLGADDYLLKDQLERLGKAVEEALTARHPHSGRSANNRSSQREMEVILSVNAALRNLPNREMMLPVIADFIQKIAPAEGTLICLTEAATGELQQVHVAGKWKEIPKFALQLEDARARAVYQAGTALSWDNPNDAPELKISPPGTDFGSLVCLPMTSSQEDIGLVWFGCETKCPDESIRLAQVVANIAATAIHRSSLNENTLRALQESEALANISRILNQNLDLDRIFRQIVKEAIGIIGDAYRAVIHLYDEKNQRLHAVALGEVIDGEIQPKSLIKIRVSASNEFDFGVLSAEDVLSASMYAGKGVAGKVIELGMPMIVGDTIQDQRYLQTGLETEARSLVVAPILSGERRLGTLSVLGSAPNLFSINDQNLLEKLCLQVSIAIENARLLEAERQQRELAQTQAEISALLNQSLSMDEVLAGIINYALRFFGAKAANIMLVEDSQLRVAKHSGYDLGSNRTKFEPLAIENLPPEDWLKKAYQTGQQVMVMDIQTDPAAKQNTSFDWLRSFVIIPLKVGRRVIGLLNVESEIPNAFGKLEMEQMEIFANSASVAVNNAQLYQVLEQTLQTEKSTRLQLIRADKLAGMGRMVASVAHELNNPLQTIKNCLFLIEQSFKEEDADLLELALSEVERLSSIVNRLRDVYRPVEQLEFQKVRLYPMLADLEMLLETHLRRHSVQLKMHKDGIEEVFVRVIPDQLKQVFLNLSLNGIEAMQPDGGELEIAVQLELQNQRVGVLFSDTGPGIPEEDLKLIFDPFYTTKAAGMGLGLSICYDIVQNHNGMIEVKNNHPSGVTFTVWLPAQLGE